MSQIYLELVQSQKQSEEDKKNLLQFFEKLLQFPYENLDHKVKLMSTFGKDSLVLPSCLTHIVDVVHKIFEKNYN